MTNPQKKILFISLTLFLSIAFAGPVLQMNRVFYSLLELVPYLQDDHLFKEKKNEKEISQHLASLVKNFKLAGHDQLIKSDLFSPSYLLLRENLTASAEAFKEGSKDYALWNLREGLAVCLDCHTRLPAEYTSSFQNGELSFDRRKFNDPYNLGIAYLIVRRYVDAKASFTLDIQEKLIRKEKAKLLQPFLQILMIECKVNKNPAGMISLINDYLKNKSLPPELRNILLNWKSRLGKWNNELSITQGLKNKSDFETFISRHLKPLKQKSFHETNKVDLLLASGILSRYSFENPEAASGAKLSYWQGWIEKRLKRDQFLSSGDLFLKQCILKYPKEELAGECLEEYRESVEFDYSGSSGTHVPKEVREELERLEKLIQNSKKR